MPTNSPPQKPIIFFDGVCAMCNAAVDFILRIDRRQVFLFAPIQGTTAQELLPPISDNPREWSLIYLDENGIYRQSDASLMVYKRIGGIWSVLGLLWYIPRFIRDPVYRFIANNRYRWFGKKEACRIPSAQERARFLP